MISFDERNTVFDRLGLPQASVSHFPRAVPPLFRCATFCLSPTPKAFLIQSLHFPRYTARLPVLSSPQTTFFSWTFSAGSSSFPRKTEDPRVLQAIRPPASQIPGSSCRWYSFHAACLSLPDTTSPPQMQCPNSAKPGYFARLSSFTLCVVRLFL